MDAQWEKPGLHFPQCLADLEEGKKVAENKTGEDVYETALPRRKLAIGSGVQRSSYYLILIWKRNAIYNLQREARHSYTLACSASTWKAEAGGQSPQG